MKIIPIADGLTNVCFCVRPGRSSVNIWPLASVCGTSCFHQWHTYVQNARLVGRGTGIIIIRRYILKSSKVVSAIIIIRNKGLSRYSAGCVLWGCRERVPLAINSQTRWKYCEKQATNSLTAVLDSQKINLSQQTKNWGRFNDLVFGVLSSIQAYVRTPTTPPSSFQFRCSVFRPFFLSLAPLHRAKPLLCEAPS